MNVEMSDLEKAAIFNAFSLYGVDGEVTAEIIAKLVIESREFTPGAMKSDHCAGFYLNFAPNELLKDLDLKGFPGTQCSFPGLEVGIIFTIFIKNDVYIHFLEGFFYGEALPISSVLQDNPPAKFGD